MIKLIDGWNKEDNIIGTVEDVASYLNIEDRVKNIYDLENELSSSEYESRYSIVPLKFEVVETYKDSDEEFVHGRFEKLEEAQKEAEYYYHGEEDIKRGITIEIRILGDPEDDNNYNYDYAEFNRGYKLFDDNDHIIAIMNLSKDWTKEDVLEIAAGNLTMKTSDAYYKYCKEDKALYEYSGEEENFESFSKTPIEREIFADCLTTEDYQKILEEYNGRLSSLPEFI